MPELHAWRWKYISYTAYSTRRRRKCDSRNWTVTVNDTAELWHPWCRANECCLHRGIPKPNWCASSYGTHSSSLSSTSFFKTLVAIAISGLAHRAKQLSQLLPSCMRYKHSDSEPDVDADACLRLTVSSFDGLIPSSKGYYCISERGYYCISERLYCHVTTASVQSEKLPSMDISLTPTEAPVRLGCGCVPRISRKLTGTLKSNKFWSYLFSLHFICIIIKCTIKCNSLFLLNAVFYFSFVFFFSFSHHY